MQKFLNWFRILVIMTIIYFPDICKAQERFDFGIHQGHFLAGDFKTSAQEFKNCIVFKIIFDDECAVKFDSSKITGRSYNWRWSNIIRHGKIM